MRESTGTKRGFRPGPGRLNFAERLMGYGVLVLLTLLFCVLYLPGPSSAQKAKDNVAGVIYETEHNTGGQEGKRAGGISQDSKDNVAGDMYQPETNTGGPGKSQAGGDKEKKIPAPNLPGVSGNKSGSPALQQGIQSADSMSVSGQQTGSTGSVLLCNEIPDSM